MIEAFVSPRFWLESRELFDLLTIDQMITKESVMEILLSENEKKSKKEKLAKGELAFEVACENFVLLTEILSRIEKLETNQKN